MTSVPHFLVQHSVWVTVSPLWPNTHHKPKQGKRGLFGLMVWRCVLHGKSWGYGSVREVATLYPQSLVVQKGCSCSQSSRSRASVHGKVLPIFMGSSPQVETLWRYPHRYIQGVALRWFQILPSWQSKPTITSIFINNWNTLAAFSNRDCAHNFSLFESCSHTS